MKFRNLLFFSISLFSLLVINGVMVHAQELQPTPSDDEVNLIARDLYCPVCENVALDVCSTNACAQWRELIREQLAEGKESREIKQYFAENYGERVLAEPGLHGWNWLMYILPVLVILIGMGVIILAFRTRKSELLERSGFEDEDEIYIKKLEEELKKLK